MTTDTNTPGAAVVSYTPDGLAVDVDGTDFREMWEHPEAGRILHQDEKAQESDRLNADEILSMANGHEPFSITDMFTQPSEFKNDDGTPRPDVWVIKLIRANGEPATILLSDHEQRAATMDILFQRLRSTNAPIKNVMLTSPWQSRGNKFFVFRPWDGQRNPAP